MRGYDAAGWMMDADVCAGSEVAAETTRQLIDPSIATIHLHIARRGCFACRVDRFAG